MVLNTCYFLKSECSRIERIASVVGREHIYTKDEAWTALIHFRA